MRRNIALNSPGIRGMSGNDPTISIINLSRNFGKEIALSAGLDHSRGDAVIVIDADLQDPPELIPALIKRWREDEADVVFARRSSRSGESWSSHRLDGTRDILIVASISCIELLFHSANEDREPRQAICPKYWQLRAAGRPER
jgi:glycosyltransferase involved in cell wall biosynthesis